MECWDETLDHIVQHLTALSKRFQSHGACVYQKQRPECEIRAQLLIGFESPSNANSL
jgi:hypothetical protein